MTQVLAAARPRHAQTYAISFSGTLEGTGTHWRASYSWQPEDTVTAVAPFAQDAAAPFLNVHFRQPIRLTRDGSEGLEALLDVRNLLAEATTPIFLATARCLSLPRTSAACAPASLSPSRSCPRIRVGKAESSCVQSGAFFCAERSQKHMRSTS